MTDIGGQPNRPTRFAGTECQLHSFPDTSGVFSKDHFWAQNWPFCVRWFHALGSSAPPPPSVARYRVRCRCLGGFEGWKPPKRGGCTMAKCPRNRHSGCPAHHTAILWGSALLGIFAPNTATNGPERAQTGVRGCAAGCCSAETARHARPIGHEVSQTRTKVPRACSVTTCGHFFAAVLGPFGPIMALSGRSRGCGGLLTRGSRPKTRI